MTPDDPVGRHERLLSTQDLADALRVSRSTLWRLRQDGLPVLRVRGTMRFDLTEVKGWLAAADPKAQLSPGRYRCRRCSYVGDVPASVARAEVRCPRCQVTGDLERVGIA
ncbi:MAG: helix-turn-helix domain-containing protein [Candidatus Rokubacteria bacterium]|nr:helix-turn-helix domain-containing protein [Candidatus Rokubacteria bacterium]